MSNRLLNAGELFQGLFSRDVPEAEVAADLDVDSFDLIPFLTHSAALSQDANGPGLWRINLTVNLFLETEGAFATVADVYAAIHRWGEDPDNGIVPGVGGIEEVEDLNAFMPVSGAVVMFNKAHRHYQGSFEVKARIHEPLSPPPGEAGLRTTYQEESL